MCFEKNCIGKIKASLAKEDIMCWKIINDDYSPIYGGKSKNMTHNITTPYVLNERAPLVKLKASYKQYGSLGFNLTISKGYHSYRYEHEALTIKIIHGTVEGKKSMLQSFVIPKGSKYYQNENQFVSETIIMINNND